MPVKKAKTKKKGKRGHPVTRWTPTARGKLLSALKIYIQKTRIPILAEFAYQNRMPRQCLYEFPELADAIKVCITKKEGALERLMLSGKRGVAVGCIFSLKQLGWKDTQTIEHSGAIDFYSMTAEERRQRIAELEAKRAAN